MDSEYAIFQGGLISGLMRRMKAMDIQEITHQVEKESIVVRQIMAAVEKVIVGQRGLFDRMLIGLLCDGHLLLEGLPGEKGQIF